MPELWPFSRRGEYRSFDDSDWLEPLVPLSRNPLLLNFGCIFNLNVAADPLLQTFGGYYEFCFSDGSLSDIVRTRA